MVKSIPIVKKYFVVTKGHENELKAEINESVTGLSARTHTHTHTYEREKR